MTIRRSKRKRGLPLFISRFDIGALGQQQLSHICVTIRRSTVEWSRSFMTFRLDIGALGQQQLGLT